MFSITKSSTLTVHLGGLRDYELQATFKYPEAPTPDAAYYAARQFHITRCDCENKIYDCTPSHLTRIIFDDIAGAVPELVSVSLYDADSDTHFDYEREPESREVLHEVTISVENITFGDVSAVEELWAQSEPIETKPIYEHETNVLLRNLIEPLGRCKFHRYRNELTSGAILIGAPKETACLNVHQLVGNGFFGIYRVTHLVAE